MNHFEYESAKKKLTEYENNLILAQAQVYELKAVIATIKTDLAEYLLQFETEKRHD